MLKGIRSHNKQLALTMEITCEALKFFSYRDFCPAHLFEHHGTYSGSLELKLGKMSPKQLSNRNKREISLAVTPITALLLLRLVSIKISPLLCTSKLHVS